MAAIVERRSRPQVTVNLDDPKDGIVNRYTTGDEINFNVTVTVREDVMIGALQITFEGTSETTIEPPGAIIKRTAATNSFLSFPFTFVLPDRLLPQACDHETSNWVLKDAHVRLPPTRGGSVFLDRQQTMPDDFAPNACRVSYIVKVSITKAASDDDSQFSSRVLAAVGKEVHIIPTVDEEPPLSAQEESVEYRPWAETLIRRGLFEITTGQLKLFAVQPRPLVVQLRGCEPSVTSSILAKLDLRFDPVEDEQPPRLDTALLVQLSSSFILITSAFSPSIALSWLSLN